MYDPYSVNFKLFMQIVRVPMLCTSFVLYLLLLVCFLNIHSIYAKAISLCILKYSNKKAGRRWYSNAAAYTAAEWKKNSNRISITTYEIGVKWPVVHPLLSSSKCPWGDKKNCVKPSKITFNLNLPIRYVGAKLVEEGVHRRPR